MARDIVIGMAGSGGDGIVSAGESLLSAAAREGFHAMMTKSFGPQIRGGESSCRVRLSERPLSNPGAVLDVAVALNWDDFLRFGAELPCGPGTVVVYESKTGVAPDALPLKGVTPAQVFSLPLGDMTKSAAGTVPFRHPVRTRWWPRPRSAASCSTAASGRPFEPAIWALLIARARRP